MSLPAERPELWLWFIFTSFYLCVRLCHWFLVKPPLFLSLSFSINKTFCRVLSRGEMADRHWSAGQNRVCVFDKPRAVCLSVCHWVFVYVNMCTCVSINLSLLSQGRFTELYATSGLNPDSYSWRLTFWQSSSKVEKLLASKVSSSQKCLGMEDAWA